MIKREHVALKASDEFLIVGVVRNCASSIEGEIQRIRAAFAPLANRVSWLLVESDSDDGSVSKLNELKGVVENFDYISCGSLRDKLPMRTDRLAYCRNRYLDELRSNPKYDAVKYVVMADLDGLNTLISTEAIVSCWDRLDWDVCTANQEGPYYDVYALRHALWSPNDCWRQCQFLVDHGVPKEKAELAVVRSKHITIPSNHEWVKVDSAFGGFAIYRRHAMRTGKYFGLDDSGEEICEHILFHRHLAENNLEIYINPRLINAGVTDNVKPMMIRYRFKRMLGNMARSVFVSKKCK